MTIRLRPHNKFNQPKKNGAGAVSFRQSTAKSVPNKATDDILSLFISILKVIIRTHRSKGITISKKFNVK